MPNYVEYQKSVAAEFKAYENRVRNLIDGHHWGEDGRFKEIILMNYLKRVLPSYASVGTGFVKSKDSITKQIDIIVYQNTYPTLFSEGDFVILPPESVIGIIEVKSKITNTTKLKQFVRTSNYNANVICGDSEKAIFNGIFSYNCTLSDETICEALNEINYNGMIYLAGMDITAEEVLKTFREWKEDEGFGKMETGVSKKVGRRSNEEREAIAKGDQGFVGKHLASLPGPTVKGQLREKLFEMYKTEYGRNASKNKWQDLKKPASAAFSKQIDVNLAKRDKEAFKQKYRTNINKSKEIMPNLTDDDIVDMLSSGMFKHFSDFREGLQKIRGEA